MGDRGVVKQVDATRIGDGIVKIENLTRRQGGAGKTPSISYTIVYAKITGITNAASGFYSADEVLINADRTSWSSFDNGRTWGTTGDSLEELFEMNFKIDLVVGDIVQVQATNIAGLGGAPKWAIVSAGLAVSAGECQDVYIILPSTFNTKGPTDPVLFGDLSFFQLQGCGDDVCGPTLCGTDPSMGLTVTGTTGTINWCGETWILPGESGVLKCVCPDGYIDNRIAMPSAISQHTWYKGTAATGLRLGRTFSTFDTPTYSTAYRGRVVARGETSIYNYIHQTALGTSPSATNTIKTTNTLFAGQPVEAKGKGARPMEIPDTFFFEYTSAGVTFKWERGRDAEWVAS